MINSPASRAETARRSVRAFPLNSSWYERWAKRGFDLTFSILISPMVLPIIGALWLLARRDGGPGFFGHARVGRDGRTFRCWKVRTMVPDAQERLDALLAESPEARAEWERDRKLRHDPRITPMGAFLRRTSLDELPQLFNVLKGEMSLIGPRPITESELEYYGGKKWAYLAMRPGITGLWQVSGRNDVSYDERVELDVAYHQSLSPAQDLSILTRTASAVLYRTGY